MLMAEITISLMFVVFSLALLSLCIRYVGRAGAQSRTLGVITGHPHLASVESDLCRLPKGMNSDVVCAFPIITYTDMKAMNVGKGLLECVVCLSEFKDRDFVRLLPKCDHAFHPECIDMWLSDHDTCPVCRTTLVPNADEKTGSEMNISGTLAPRNNNFVISIDEADGIGTNHLIHDSQWIGVRSNNGACA